MPLSLHLAVIIVIPSPSTTVRILLPSKPNTLPLLFSPSKKYLLRSLLGVMFSSPLLAYKTLLLPPPSAWLLLLAQFVRSLFFLPPLRLQGDLTLLWWRLPLKRLAQRLLWDGPLSLLIPLDALILTGSMAHQLSWGEWGDWRAWGARGFVGLPFAPPLVPASPPTLPTKLFASSTFRARSPR